MKVLITGGAGFIGSHITEQLQGRADITILDDLSTGSKKNLQGFQYRLIEGSVTDIDKVNEAMQGCDYVLHLAAFISVVDSIKHPDECMKVNVNGTDNVIRCAAKNNVKKIIFSSSCAVYGDNPELPKTEDSPTEPTSPYAESKLQGERLCAQASQHGLKSACLRYFNVYGPRQDPKSKYAAAIPLFIDSAINDREIKIFGDGKQTRDFIYVKDVARANIFAMENLEGTYNVGSGSETHIIDLARKILTITGSKSEITYEKARSGEILRSFADINRLRSRGFSQSYDLDAGLKETIDHHREDLAKDR